MKLIRAASLLWAGGSLLLATSCANLPMCARIRASSIYFLGTVFDSRQDGEDAAREVRFQVEEIFMGLPPSTREVSVAADASWLRKGHTYLMEVDRGNDGRLYTVICGASGDIENESIAKDLEYLRRRARGKATTSMSVSVVDQYRPLANSEVSIAGSGKTLKMRTGTEGLAVFDELPPAKYHVTATRLHYHPDAEAHSTEEVEVIAGSCASASVSLAAESGIAGLVRDARGLPAGGLQLELVTAPKDPAEPLSLSQPFFEDKTDAEGRFAFPAVSPGRYLLGTNVIGLNTSAIPATYYPGQRSREGAVPIEVTLGETADNLIFTLPDFGGPREIHLCVVDERGMPAASAEIRTGYRQSGGDYARLGENLTTDQTGCVAASGFSGAAYSVFAVLRGPGSDVLHTRISDSMVIERGEGPVHAVLVLKAPLASPGKKGAATRE